MKQFYWIHLDQHTNHGLPLYAQLIWDHLLELKIISMALCYTYFSLILIETVSFEKL